MALPRTKEQALRQMRAVWFSLAISIPLYPYIGNLERGISWLRFRNAGETFTILAALNLVSFSWFALKRYLPAKESLQSHRDDEVAVKRWMTYWTMLVCNANSVVLFGFALWMAGNSLERSLLFFVIGSFLILGLWPRPVWPPSKAATA